MAAGGSVAPRRGRKGQTMAFLIHFECSSLKALQSVP